MTTPIPSMMSGTFLLGNRRCEVRTVPVPQPGYGQVLIQMRASTLCGSDLRAIYRPSVHKTDAEGYLGVIAGHEPCGLIVTRGDGRGARGRVQLYTISKDAECAPIAVGANISPATRQNGRPTAGSAMAVMVSELIPNMFAGLSSLTYFQGEYLLADQQSLVRLPEPLTYLDGAIVACGLGTAYAACMRAQISGRDCVLVTGLGPVGLGTALVAQRLGAAVLGIEFDPERVAFARKIGIESVICGADGNADVNSAAKWARCAGEGVDVAIDCSGNAEARLTCMKATRPWGRVVFVGEGGDVTVEVSPVIIHKSLTIYGSWVCSISQMEELVEKMVKWNLHPEITVTDIFAINDAAKAYELFDSGKTGKCAIVYQGEQKVH